MDTLPESDRIDGAPHPRMTARLFGHSAVEDAFLEAYTSGRLHHAWMFTGPRGIGKATLCWRIARFLLAEGAHDSQGGAGLIGLDAPPLSLDVSSEHPVARRIGAGSEPGIFVLRRPYDEKAGRLRQEITVDETRKLKGFFSLSSPDGGWRVVIVDAVDEMNVSASNALLKILEEPPSRAIVLLVAHQPSSVLATIRSRCRKQPLAPLGAEDMHHALLQADQSDPSPGLAELAGGSVGAAMRLATLEGVDLYQRMIALFSGLPRLDRGAIDRLAESVAPRNVQERFDLLIDLIDIFLARLARAGATGTTGPEIVEGENSLLLRLSRGGADARAWAQLQQTASTRLRHARRVNLDPQSLVLDICLAIERQARDRITP